MLKLILDWFDYIYYRSSLTYRFFKDDGNFSPTMVVALIKSIFIIDLCALLLYIFTDQEFIDSHLGGRGAAAGMVFAVTFLLDYRRYNGKFEELREKWKNELRGKRIWKGFLVFFTFVVPWVPLIVKSMINN